MPFDITKALADIARKPDGQKQIQYIPLHLIDTNPKNNYSTNGIQSLAANIQMFGLLDPLIVKETPDRRYMLISGHRRRLALRMNAEAAENYPDSMHEPVPCIVEPEDAPLPGIEDPEKAAAARPLAEELKLIYANADTRVMSSADTAQQVRKTRELLLALQDLGYKFPGKMRDHVAAAAKVSATRVARLDVIDKGLKEPALRKAWKDGALGETAAYEIARRSPEAQHAAATFTGPDALQKMTTEQIDVAMDHYEQRAEEDRKARKEWNRNVGTMAEATKAAEPEKNVKSDFSADEYLKKLHEEDTILRELCRKNVHSILRELMFFKSEYNFDENYRQANIDRMRKNDRYSSYSVGWNANDGTGTCIDWNSKGIDVKFGRRPRFHKSWPDFYDVLCGAALDKVWRTEETVSAADTDDDGPDPDDGNDLRISTPAWIQGDPDHDGRYFCRVLIGKDAKPHEQRMEWKSGGWRVFGDPIDKYDMTVQSWWPLPPEV